MERSGLALLRLPSPPRLPFSTSKPRFYKTSPAKPPSTMASMGHDPIREWILKECKAKTITRISPIGGGCINLANRYDTDAGSFFINPNRSIGPSMFEGEVLGLDAMYATKTICVPQPYKFGELPTGGSYIILEFIEFGPSRGSQVTCYARTCSLTMCFHFEYCTLFLDIVIFIVGQAITFFQSALGRKLAEMHKAGKSEKGFGFEVNNTIGSTPQINTWCSDWVDFYAEHRLGYQLNMALQQYGDSNIHEKGSVREISIHHAHNMVIISLVQHNVQKASHGIGV